MTVAELFTRIGIKTDEGKLKSFQTRLGAAKTGMIGITAAAAGVSFAIGKITNDAMKSAVAFKQFEVETGASAQSLQKWQAVALQTNQTAESVTAAIKSIAANREKIKLGEGNIKGYQLLGIDPNQDPFEILEQLRTKTEGMTDAMKKNVLAQMGVGAGLLQTLQLSRQEFDAMASKAFIIQPGAIETLNKMKSSVDLAGRGIKYMKAQIAVGLAPQITALTKKFTDFMKVNEKAIVKGFKEGFNFVKIFSAALINTANVINRLVRSTVGWENAIKGVLVVIGILNASLLASPMGIFIAGIILLVAVLDDLYVYSKGGKSLFGNMVEKVPELGEVFDSVFGTIKDVMSLIKAFATGDDMGIDAVLDQWGIFGDLIQKIKEGLEYISGEKFSAMREEAQAARGGTLSGYERMMGISPSGASGDTNNSMNVTINGSDNADTVAEKIKGAWQSMINGASAQRGRDE